MNRRARLPDLLIWVVIGVILAVAIFVSIGQAFRPYATLAEAARSRRAMQIKGTVVEGTLREAGGQVSFEFRDSAGTTAQVRLAGPMPPRLPEAEAIVVIGQSAGDGAFVARQVLIRCPTRFRD
ncbi:MAG TPA: cytochrome c maturation protein CcmE [Bacillota bacterium]|nr:cytochrome c maturation protein CcmE [Bacillota bacterium]